MESILTGIAPPALRTMDRATDRQLLAWAAQRDDAACNELISRYGRKLYALVERSHGDLQLSEDIVQDAFFRAIEAHTQLREESAFFPWLVRIAFRRAVDYRRKARREALVDIFTFAERSAPDGFDESSLDDARNRDGV
ncbi:MAG: sigma-70 family RNA polymerase sigma factor, partial [Myxococcota bacterium]